MNEVPEDLEPHQILENPIEGFKVLISKEARPSHKLMEEDVLHSNKNFKQIKSSLYLPELQHMLMKKQTYKSSQYV